MFFFFNDTATTEIYTLSLHDALPILVHLQDFQIVRNRFRECWKLLEILFDTVQSRGRSPSRSEEHTSELQSRQYLVCRLLLEKKKINIIILHNKLFNHKLCTIHDRSR